MNAYLTKKSPEYKAKCPSCGSTNLRNDKLIEDGEEFCKITVCEDCYNWW